MLPNRLPTTGFMGQVGRDCQWLSSDPHRSFDGFPFQPVPHPIGRGAVLDIPVSVPAFRISAVDTAVFQVD